MPSGPPPADSLDWVLWANRDPAHLDSMFLAVAMDAEAGTIIWPNDADLSPRTLYLASKPAVLA